MILGNLTIIDSRGPVNIQISDDKITKISSPGDADTEASLKLIFDNAVVFPGLINSHDHLDFNLFTQLGDKIYSNYTQWGKYIHKTYKEEIAKVLKVPLSLRAQWGVYKNLLCGVTTVINHGERLGIENALVTVFEDTHCLHSVQFEKGWRIKLNNPFKMKLPVNIHVGEGDDWLSFHEIDKLTRWNLLRKKLIGVHAVAMSENQAKKFEAIVWCPQSNYFLLNKTARVNLLKKNTNLLFGTDSTLTSNWNIWDHLQTARKTNLISDEALYETLNKNAAKTWHLNSGVIAPGKDADLVVAKINQHKTDFETFFSIGPADILLVIHKGDIRLFDETMLAQLKTLDLSNFSKIHINGINKYVQGNLPGLIKKIREYNPEMNFPVNDANQESKY